MIFQGILTSIAKKHIGPFIILVIAYGMGEKGKK